jgi:hypothetical protein
MNLLYLQRATEICCFYLQVRVVAVGLDSSLSLDFVGLQ